MPPLVHVGSTLWAARVPIPYPMRFVTVLVDAGPPVTLVDAAVATSEAEAALGEALGELSLRWEDIERLVVTHHHPDHYGLAGTVQERSGAEVLMLGLDIERGERFWRRWDSWLTGHVAHFLRHGLPPERAGELREESLLTRTRVRPAERLTPLAEGDRLVLGGESFEVLWLPGHADGHLALWSEAGGLLIAGDVILGGITPNVGLWAYSRPDPLADYLASLGRVVRLEPERAVVGHGGPVLEDPAGRAREIAAHHEERLERALAALTVPMTAYEASYHLFPQELPPSGRRFATAETLAHLEYLRLRGELVGGLEGGVYRFARPR